MNLHDAVCKSFGGGVLSTANFDCYIRSIMRVRFERVSFAKVG